MKDFLKKIIAGLAYGIGFGISISAVVYVSHWLEESDKPRYPSHKEVRNPEGVEIISSRLLTIGDYVFVSATVINNSDRLWESVSLHAELYDSEGYLATCDEINDMEPHEKLNIDLVCFKIRTDLIPEGVTHKTFIGSASEKI